MPTPKIISVCSKDKPTVIESALVCEQPLPVLLITVVSESNDSDDETKHSDDKTQLL